MILTNENYYSPESNMEYMSVSQYKQFKRCEAATMAELRGEWQQPKSTALLVGSYVDACLKALWKNSRRKIRRYSKRTAA